MASLNNGPQTEETHEREVELERARRRGRLWVMAVGAVSLGLIACMCAFVIIAVNV